MAEACDKLDKGSGACQTTGKDVEQARRRRRGGRKNREREQKQARGQWELGSGCRRGREKGSESRGLRVHCGTRHSSAETEAAPKRAPDERHNANTINAS